MLLQLGAEIVAVLVTAFLLAQAHGLTCLPYGFSEVPTDSFTAFKPQQAALSPYASRGSQAETSPPKKRGQPRANCGQRTPHSIGLLESWVAARDLQSKTWGQKDEKTNAVIFLIPHS